MAAITRFAPPANIDDLSEPERAAWSDGVKGWFETAKQYLLAEKKIAPGDLRLFHLLEGPQVQGGPQAQIPWNGFPRKFSLLWPNAPETRWTHADGIYQADLNGRGTPYYYKSGSRWTPAADIPFRDQDEYCEWHVVRNAQGEPGKIVFTCENPEYWKFMHERDAAKVLELYRQLVSPAIAAADLIFQKDIYVRDQDQDGKPVMVNKRGSYNPYNKWNTTDGAVHLTHPANSLEAEVYLAADATILRKDGAGQPITDDNALICAAGYGGPNRSSDPTIGSKINNLVRNALAVTIDDPVGLYIHSLDTSAINVPGGGDAEQWWQVVRGSRENNMILRGEFAPPAGSALKLSDVTVGGETLNHGGQLAELVTMVIYGRGLTAQKPSEQVAAYHCCHDPDLPRLQEIVDIGRPCPPEPHPAAHPLALTISRELATKAVQPVALDASEISVRIKRT
jgi:hypothetical protein